MSATCVDSWWARPRANPAASKAMARVERLIKHGWKPSMAQYMALREAESSGFKLIIRCVNSAREMGQHIDGLADGRIEYMISVLPPAKITPVPSLVHRDARST